MTTSRGCCPFSSLVKGFRFGWSCEMKVKRGLKYVEEKWIKRWNELNLALIQSRTIYYTQCFFLLTLFHSAKMPESSLWSLSDGFIWFQPNFCLRCAWESRLTNSTIERSSMTMEKNRFFKIIKKIQKSRSPTSTYDPFCNVSEKRFWIVFIFTLICLDKRLSYFLDRDYLPLRNIIHALRSRLDQFEPSYK